MDDLFNEHYIMVMDGDQTDWMSGTKSLVLFQTHTLTEDCDGTHDHT